MHWQVVASVAALKEAACKSVAALPHWYTEVARVCTGRSGGVGDAVRLKHCETVLQLGVASHLSVPPVGTRLPPSDHQMHAPPPVIPPRAPPHSTAQHSTRSPSPPKSTCNCTNTPLGAHTRAR